MSHAPRAGWGLFALYMGQAIRGAVSIDSCPSSARSFDVATTEEARDLATALNCSGGGSFNVLWEGAVIVDQTIALTDGSVVNIAGVGSGAIADGGGNTQLFTVSNATLFLVDVGLENGYSAYEYSGGGFEFSSGSGGAIWAGGDDAVVSWGGTTFFHNNLADNGGAVSIVDGAVGSWSGDTSFIGNTADGVYGGALQVLNNACVSWSGQTNFTANNAGIGGGALYSNGGIVTWTGETTFAENSALVRGGTILIVNSEASWSGVTSFEDSKLRSGYESGGTVQAEDSVLSWRGETSFNGSSGGVGGALHVAGSSVDWGGKTFFCDNVVDIMGGALYSDSSSEVSWTGETYFCNNRAAGIRDSGTGGAIHATGSTFSWNGTTTFTNNSAATGGAFHVGDGTSIVWSGATTFASNFAVTGGAIYAEGGASMGWGGTTTFADNTASLNGGAVALITDLSLDLGAVGTTLSLTGNVAGVAGGAVYQSAITFGLTWNAVSFVSNSAVIGGAMYSATSGVAVVGNTEFPSVFVNCTFRGNTAAASGGAIESVAGKDNFINTTFESNTAGSLGGSLRMAGTTTLTRCDFVGNGANALGPAVTNDGTTTVANSSFTKNSLLCAPGTFLNYTIEGYGTPEQGADAYYDSICDGCSLCTGNCLVDGIGTQQCIQALENTKSTGVDPTGMPITLQTLEVDPGYWRSTPSSTTILPCWNEDACLGGITDTEGFCDDGYKGPYCAICTHDYAATLAYTCSKCSSGAGIVFAVLALIAALAAIVAVISHLVSKPHDRTNTRLRQLMQDLPVQGLKTVVVAWQILTQFDSVANVTYAGVYGRFLDGIASLVSLDLGLVLSAGCMARTDFHDRLIISTLGPLVALGALGISLKVATKTNHGSEEALQTVRRKHFSMALLLTFLVYSSVSSDVFRMFACETLDGGKEYLRADYTIQCTSSKHKALQVYAAFMIALYPIGIPALYGIVLFKHREVLRDGRSGSVQQWAYLNVTAALWKPYKPARYYYEVVECVRRVTLTGFVVFIYPNTAAQVAVTLVLAFVFVMVSESLAPYTSTQESWLSRVAHVVVFLSMFQALAVKVDVSRERSDSQEVFGGVLLVTNICMVAAVIIETILLVCSVCGRGDTDLEESVVPGVRTSTSTKSVAESWDVIESDDAPTFGGSTS